MTEPHVRFERDDTIAVVRLNRPAARNAITKQMLCLLDEAWDEVERDDAIRIAVITGQGGFFCAGGDLKSLDADDHDGSFAARFDADGDLAFRALMRSRRLSKPLVAAIEGPAAGGGLDFVLAADIRVASDTATFGLPEVAHGIFPMGGTTVRLPRQVPLTDAMYLLLTGELVEAPDALRMGLVSKVVPRGGAFDEAVRIARVIAANAPLAVRAVKRSVHLALNMTEKEGLDIELQTGGPILQSADLNEGIQAFREKRRPRFEGR